MAEESGETVIGSSIAHIEEALTEKDSARSLTLLNLLAAPWTGLLAKAFKPSPREMSAQRWPAIIFVRLYQIALNRQVEIQGLDHLPKAGPVILAGNHINKTGMDAMLMGSKILIERGRLVKFVSQAAPRDRMLQYFIRLMGNTTGVLLPVHKGSTTETMVQFLRNPEAFKRQQPILGIFPVGTADRDFEAHMKKTWHTSAAVAAVATSAPIVPFFVEGLPYHWGPLHILKAVARSLVGRNALQFKIRFGAPIQTDDATEERNYSALSETVRQAVLRLAIDSGGATAERC